MKYSNLGSTGIKVSNLCLGMMSFGNSQKWHLEIEDAKPIVDYALDNGINFFDTANVYGESMGKMFYEPVRIACLMKKEDQNWSSDDFGSNVDQTIDFRFLKVELKEINFPSGE